MDGVFKRNVRKYTTEDVVRQAQQHAAVPFFFNLSLQRVPSRDKSTVKRITFKNVRQQVYISLSMLPRIESVTKRPWRLANNPLVITQSREYVAARFTSSEDKIDC